MFCIYIYITWDNVDQREEDVKRLGDHAITWKDGHTLFTLYDTHILSVPGFVRVTVHLGGNHSNWIQGEREEVDDY